jgi:hypothetical protein
MKKILLLMGAGLIIIVVLLAVVLSLFLDGAVKRGVETFGPKLTKVDITLDDVSLSLFSGSASIKGLVVGNPEGFKSPEAIRVGSASLALQPRSLLADKIVVRSVRVDAPEIAFELGAGGNNLGKILANVKAASGTTDTNTAAKAETSGGKKLQVDDFVITGAKVSVGLTQWGGKNVTVIIPDIHLQKLGQGPEGITSAELTQLVLAALEKAALKAADKAAEAAVSELRQSAVGALNDLSKGSTGAVENITRSVKDLFKKP